MVMRELFIVYIEMRVSQKLAKYKFLTSGYIEFCADLLFQES